MCIKYIKVNCPYCGTENKILLAEGSHFVWCEIECHPDACDQEFVVKVKLRPECKAFKLVDATVPESNK